MILRYRLSPSYGPTFLASLRHNPGGCSCNEKAEIRIKSLFFCDTNTSVYTIKL